MSPNKSTEGTMTVSSNPAVWAGITAPEGFELGWKVVRPDGRTRRDYRWPFSGPVVATPAPDGFTRGDPCPTYPGDGLCIAKTWRGAASGGIPAITGLALTYRTEDVLGEDENKLRVSACNVVAVLDLARLIREGHASYANLSSANFSGADLSYADLTGANLTDADLTDADLSGADLTRADLTGANLSSANFSGADLSYANLTGANLTGANLSSANLRCANLTRANLRCANLTRADLTRADLSGANLSYADLTGANLRCADLTRADLSGANLTRADRRGANLSGANGYTP